MPVFSVRRSNVVPAPVRGVLTIRKGIEALLVADFENALRLFRSVASSRHPRTNRLVKSVANFYAYNTERIRKEVKKQAFGNAHLINNVPGNNRNAWSDVDIAAVLVAPNSPRMDAVLCGALGRTSEAIRFQRRYVGEQPLTSWVSETGERYTRFTQTQKVARRLGLV